MQHILTSLPLETQVFIGLILFSALALHVRFNVRSVSNGPTFLTTLGIFATFVGIALGLSRFDVNDVQGSIPVLLEGLKTAFWASVFGVGAALTIKFRDHVAGHQQDPAHYSQEEIGGKEILEGLGRVEKALVGGEEGSLIGQIKLLRTDTREELKLLREAQTKALEKLSEMGSRTLIEALKDVIRDFNQRLTEQFGENFKQLNAAVEKLVEWQVQYREFVDTSSLQLTVLLEKLATTTADYSKVVDRSSEFAKQAEALGLTISDIQNRQGDLRRQSEALAELLKQSSSALPEVERKVTELARQLSDGVSQSQKTIDEALRSQMRVIDDAVRTTGESIKRSSEDSARSLSQIAERSVEQMGTNLRRLSEQLDENHKATATSIRANADALSQEIRSKINEAIQLSTSQIAQVQSLTSRAQEDLSNLAKGAATSIVQLSEAATNQVANSTKQIVDQVDATTKSVANDLAVQSTTLGAAIKTSVDAAIRSTTEQTSRATAASEAASAEISARAKEAAKIVGEAQQGFTKSISEGAESLRSSMRTSIESMAAANSEHNRQLADLASKTKDQVAVLDKALGEELERSLQSLGRQLAALSEKFVSDYQPLTENLRRVVEIAKRVNVQ